MNMNENETKIMFDTLARSVKRNCIRRNIKNEEVIDDLISEALEKAIGNTNWINLEENHKINYLRKISANVVNDYLSKNKVNPAYLRFIKRIRELLIEAGFTASNTNKDYYTDEKYLRDKIDETQKISDLKNAVLEWKKLTKFKPMKEDKHKDRAKTFISNKEFIDLLTFVGKKIKFSVFAQDIYTALNVIFSNLEEKKNPVHNESDFYLGNSENNNESEYLFDYLSDENNTLQITPEYIIENNVNEFINNFCDKDLLLVYFLKDVKKEEKSLIEKYLGVKQSAIYERYDKFKKLLIDFIKKISFDEDEAIKFLGILDRKLKELFGKSIYGGENE